MPTQKIPPVWHACIKQLYVGGLTQQAIADALGVSMSRVRQICNGYEHIKDEHGVWQVRKVPLQRKGE